MVNHRIPSIPLMVIALLLLVFTPAHSDDWSNLRSIRDSRGASNHPVPAEKSRLDLSESTAELEISINKRGSVVKYDDPLGEATLGGVKMTCNGGAEDELLLELVAEVARQDPDIIFTSGGDSFVIPYLYHRAEVNGINDKFQLGREHDRVYSDYTPTAEQDEFSADELTSSSNIQANWSLGSSRFSVSTP